jgi:hypothetical protein
VEERVSLIEPRLHLGLRGGDGKARAADAVDLRRTLARPFVERLAELRVAGLVPIRRRLPAEGTLRRKRCDDERDEKGDRNQDPGTHTGNSSKARDDLIAARHVTCAPQAASLARETRLGRQDLPQRLAAAILHRRADERAQQPLSERVRARLTEIM